ALLFASDTPVEPALIQEVLDLPSADGARELIESLRRRFDEQARALQIIEVGGGFRLVTRPEIAPWLVKLARSRTRSRLSRPSLETLAIIGYRQPVSRPEVDAIRGVNSEAVLDNLLERRMIRIAGRKESPGRPFLYETTREFLVAFGLRDLGDLPKVEGELIVPELAADAAAQLVEPETEAAPEHRAEHGSEQGEIAAATDSSEQDPGSGGDRVTAGSGGAARGRPRPRQRAGPARAGRPGGPRARPHHGGRAPAARARAAPASDAPQAARLRHEPPRSRRSSRGARPA